MLPLVDERGAEDPEDGARRADGGNVAREGEHCGGGAQAGDEVDEQEPQVADRALHRRPDPVEHQHVEADVDQARVQKGRRDHAVPLALRDADRLAVDQMGVSDQGVVDEQAPLRRVVERPALEEAEEEHADVEDHERARDDGVAAPEELSAGLPWAHRRALDAARRVIRAADADRREDHAVRADPAAAFRARHAGLAVGMAIAPQQLGHGPSVVTG